MLKIACRLLSLIILVSASALADTRPQAKVLIIPKGINLTFWQVVEAGVKQASNDLNTPVIWRGPYNDDDLNSQIAIIRNYLDSDIQVLAVAAIDAHMLTPFILQYQRRGKQILVFDSEAIGVNPLSFIASNNYQAGVSLVKSIESHLPKEIHAVIVQNDSGHASTEDRAIGIQEQLKKYPVSSVKLIDGGPTRGSALHETYDTLVAHPEINLILTVNEATTEGAALAIRKLNRSNVIVAGFDLNDTIYRLLNEGIITQLVLQDPYAMGYLVMQQAAKLLAGERIEPRYEIPIRLVNKQSLSDADIAAFLRQYLASD
ncbi:substrate-binding domain-containing protein [Motilimonas sp. KMU-193]|uniref:substrate-binding domain-containing protein n=1 Tax=Motilimonas sp. KMU-193 TaxID=3388668 RepID=UPI00396B307C